MKNSILLLLLTVFMASCMTQEDTVTPENESSLLSADVKSFLTQSNIDFQVSEGDISFEIPSTENSFVASGLTPIFAKYDVAMDLENAYQKTNARPESCTTIWRFEEIDCLCGEMIVTVCTDCSGEWECMITFQ